MPPSRQSTASPSSSDHADTYSLPNSPSFQALIQQTIETQILSSLEGKRYTPKSVGPWVNAINKNILDSLALSCSNFKFFSSIVLTENPKEDDRSSSSNKEGDHRSSGKEESKSSGGGYKPPLSTIVQNAALWNGEADGMVVVEWGNESMACVVTVCGCLI
jgi:hypothetical protein